MKMIDNKRALGEEKKGISDMQITFLFLKLDGGYIGAY